MKYGYLFYQKPLIETMNTRPVNLGDPIQSYAVKNLYREMGIREEDIVPVPRYDITTYDGEECICVINTASNYEELAYDSHFMPPSKKVHAIPMSLHLHRDIPADELEFYRSCGGVGCRDLATVDYLQSLGVDAYLSGCLTLTLPRRSKETESKADKIYFVDIAESVMPYVPEEIKNQAIELTNIVRFKNPGNAKRISVEDAYLEHKNGEERIDLLRDTAKLVVTSKLHIASPCVAMGIPVVLIKNHFGDRFGFIDRLIPTYTPERYSEIDWNPKPVDFEEDKLKIKEVFWNKVRAMASRLELEKMWDSKEPIYDISYETSTSLIMRRIASKFTKDFKYAVWGIVLSGAFYLEESIREEFPEAQLVNGIDIASTYDFCGVPTIHPNKIDELDEDVIIFVAAPSAQEMAKDKLLKTNRKFVLLKGKATECYNF